MSFMRALTAFGGRAAAIGAALGIAAAGAATAQSLPEPERFSESFVGAAAAPAPTLGGGARGAFTIAPGPDVQLAVVGRLLVGLSIGEGDAPVDLRALRLAAPAGRDDDRLCVTLATDDGRYSASSAHRIDADFSGPAALGLETAYAAELAEYGLDDLMVSAVRATSCDGDPEGARAPALLDAGAETLIVSLSIGQGRPIVWLERNGEAVARRVRCEAAPSVSRTHACRLPVRTLEPGRYTLVVRARRLDGPALVERFDLALP